MHGGELFAEIAIVAGLTVAGVWLIWIMIVARDDLRRADDLVHGDVPHLPEDAKGSRSKSVERGGTSALGGTRASVRIHSRTPSQCPRGDAV